jgi:hypothetical protein
VRPTNSRQVDLAAPLLGAHISLSFRGSNHRKFEDEMYKSTRGMHKKLDKMQSFQNERFKTGKKKI